MKTISLPVWVTTTMLSGLALSAQAGETITGRIVGYACAHEATQCPIDKLDPHIALERDFVLVSSPGEYYFLPNLPRDTKVRYVLDRVTVNGEVNEKYKAIDVDELIVERRGKNRTVWSNKMQLEIFGRPTTQ